MIARLDAERKPINGTIHGHAYWHAQPLNNLDVLSNYSVAACSNSTTNSELLTTNQLLCDLVRQTCPPNTYATYVMITTTSPTMPYTKHTHVQFQTIPLKPFRKTYEQT